MRTLLQLPSNEVLCFQSLAHTLRKIPGIGYPSPNKKQKALTEPYNKLNGSISTKTAVCGISFASQYAIHPLSSFVSTDRFGDFSRN